MENIFITVSRVALVFGLTCSKRTFSTTQQSCESRIYCQGQVLDYVQRARVFPDSKTFVDMRLTKPVDKILEEFNRLLEKTDSNPSKSQLKQFVESHFSSIDELEDWSPPDYKPDPQFLNEIKDEDIKIFAKDLVSIWPELGRKLRPEVASNTEQYSIIPLPNGFIIPGGRFKEIYYWDSYWIIKGLLISDMKDTARGMLENFLAMINKYGFIPNGSRVYYLNRSQPPLFTKMVDAYIDATNDLTWLKKNIDLIVRETQFWLDNKLINVKKEGKTYTMAHYSSKSGTPRPESYYEDVNTASIFSNETDRERLFMELKSGAETGWDFSSRWIFDKKGGFQANLSHIETTRVVPVDLNSFLCGNFKLLRGFYDKLGLSENSKYWAEIHEQWKEAIQNVLYDETDKIWYDFDAELGVPRKGFYPSNLTPLWAGAVDGNKLVTYGDQVAEYIKSLELDVYKGGIPTSLEHTGEQWDFPNAWPPLQSIVIFGLQKTGSEKAASLAKNFAENYLKSNMVGYRESSSMYEKYDAVNVGQRGGGGEYNVQTGFGWTNGVALEIIDYYYRNK